MGIHYRSVDLRSIHFIYLSNDQWFEMNWCELGLYHSWPEVWISGSRLSLRHPLSAALKPKLCYVCVIKRFSTSWNSNHCTYKTVWAWWVSHSVSYVLRVSAGTPVSHPSNLSSRFYCWEHHCSLCSKCLWRFISSTATSSLKRPNICS